MSHVVIAILFLAHGVGHVLFLANSWGFWKVSDGRSPLFENLLHASQTTEGLIGLLWLVPLVGFVMSAWGCYSESPWWRIAALVSALISTSLIAVWISGLNMSSAFFALVVNAAIAVILLWQQSTGIAQAQ